MGKGEVVAACMNHRYTRPQFLLNSLLHCDLEELSSKSFQPYVIAVAPERRFANMGYNLAL